MIWMIPVLIAGTNAAEFLYVHYHSNGEVPGVYPRLELINNGHVDAIANVGGVKIKIPLHLYKGHKLKNLTTQDTVLVNVTSGKILLFGKIQHGNDILVRFKISELKPAGPKEYYLTTLGSQQARCVVSPPRATYVQIKIPLRIRHLVHVDKLLMQKSFYHLQANEILTIYLADSRIFQGISVSATNGDISVFCGTHYARVHIRPAETHCGHRVETKCPMFKNSNPLSCGVFIYSTVDSETFLKLTNVSQQTAIQSLNPMAPYKLNVSDTNVLFESEKNSICAVYVEYKNNSKITYRMFKAKESVTSFVKASTMDPIRNLSTEEAESTCPCACDNTTSLIGHLSKDISAKIDTLKRTLSVNKSTLSKQKRRKISVMETRASAQSLGMVAISVLCCTALMILMSDFNKFCLIFNRNRKIFPEV